MVDLLNQINADIKNYQVNHPNEDRLKNVNWAFNYWILDKIYHIDESIISDYITDIHDNGIDCYVWDDEAKELHLIQNKNYTSTPLDAGYVKNHFLVGPKDILESGNYSHNEELQKRYNKYKTDPDFSISLELFITNNEVSDNILDIVNDFNKQYLTKNIKATIFPLSKIIEIYWSSPDVNSTTFEYDFMIKNKESTMTLNVTKEHLPLLADVRQVFAPILSIYSLYKTAENSKYPLFKDNVRDYLGSNRVNKNIIKTLQSEDDRNNFVYYNNGITMIVDEMGELVKRDEKLFFKIKNPQIVNGCQTTNSIFNVVDYYRPSERESVFKDTYVMLKILRIPKESNDGKKLAKDIVLYNNSQNELKMKYVNSQTDIFERAKKEFANKGIMICTRQSDRNKYKSKLRLASLKDKADAFLELFGLNFKKIDDYLIDLDKLLQVFISFYKNGSIAFLKKNKLLDITSPENKDIHDFFSMQYTWDDLICLFFFYKKIESLNVKGVPPYYALSYLGKYLCQNTPNQIGNLFKNKESTNNAVDEAVCVCKNYYYEWKRTNAADYNTMIKSKVIDWGLMEKYCEIYRDEHETDKRDGFKELKLVYTMDIENDF